MHKAHKIRVKSLIIKNFKNMSYLKTNINEDVTYLVGKNGAGKTTIIDALWISLLGKNAMPKLDRFKMIKQGAEKAEIVVVLTPEEGGDITVKRTITPKDCYLKIFQDGDVGRELNQKFLNDIISEFSINPLRFARLDPTSQALALGIDCSEVEAKIKESESDRRFAGRDLKRVEAELASMGTIEHVKPVDIAKTAKALGEIRDHNQKAAIVKEKIERYETGISGRKAEIEELKELIVDMESFIEKHKDDCNILDTLELEKKLEEANSVNFKARMYEKYQTERETYKKFKTEYDNANADVAKHREEKLALIVSKKFPFKNLEIGDEGHLLIDQKPFNENFFSKGEIYKIASKLINHINPELKTIFVQDSNLVDPENLNQILSIPGFQFIVEYMSEKKHEHAIYLRESKQVDSFDEEEVEAEEPGEVL